MNRVKSVYTLITALAAWLGLGLLCCAGVLEFPLNLLGLPLMLTGVPLWVTGVVSALVLAFAAGRPGLRDPLNLAAILLSVLACSPCWLPLFAGPITGQYAYRGMPVICVAEGGRYQWLAEGEVPWDFRMEGDWRREEVNGDNDFSFDGRLSHTGLTWNGHRTITLHRGEPDVVLVRIGPCARSPDGG